MANYSQLKAAINAVITANGANEITGTVLNDVLNTMVTSIGSGYLFQGIATPSTAPGTPDQNVFYIGGSGTYSNFGNTPVTIGAYEIGFFKYNGTWSNEKVTLTVDEQVTLLSDNLITSGAVAEAINNALNEGYLFKGVATPSMTPAGRAHKIFYLAVEGGTYTNFQNYGTPITLQDGISIIYGDVTWIPQLLVGIDDNPTSASDNLVRSGGVASHIVYDISEANSGATFADLTAALNNGNNIPASIRKGGMSVKFVQSSDNKYVQYRLMSQIFRTEVYYWQNVESSSIDNAVKQAFGRVQVDEMVGYRLNTNGSLVTEVGYVSDFVPVTQGQEFYFSGSLGNDVCLFIAYYTSSSENTFISGLSIADLSTNPYFSKIIIPEGAQYLRYSTMTENNNYSGSLVHGLYVLHGENSYFYKELNRLIKTDSKTALTVPQYAVWESGYRLSSSGTKVTGDGSITNFIPVIPGQKYYYRASRTSNSNLDIAGYTSDDESTFVSEGMPDNYAGASEALVLRSIIIPNDVNFIRLQQIGVYPSEYGFWKVPTGGLLEASVQDLASRQQSQGYTGVLLENPVAASYLHNVDYTNNPDYTVSYIQDYSTITTDYQKSRPFPVTIQWEPLSGNAGQRVEVSDTLFFTKKWSYTLGASNVITLDIYNLIPNKRYYWRVYNTISGLETLVTNGSFDVFGRCRMLYIDGQGTLNYRDLGGWELPGGKHIKYGRLIRGAENYRPDAGIEISQAGIDMLVNNLQISVELDFGDIWQDTALPNTVEFLHGAETYGFMAYDRPDGGLSVAFGRQKYYNSLHAVIERLSNGKNIYFHCNAGADRTGTFAFLIEALLGVSESDLSKDYELTSFYTLRQRNNNAGGDYGYYSMIAWINANYTGNTLNEKVYDLCTRTAENGGIGLSEAEITTLRTIMIEYD